MNDLMAVLTIAALATLSPGPDFAVVSRNSIMLSRRAGIMTAIGISSAVMVHVSYTLIGVGVLIRNSPWLLSAMRLAGAAYLIYLGIGMLRSKPASLQTANDVPPLSDTEAFRCGFLTNLLNPKTSIFVISLFMQVINFETPILVQIGYGACIVWIHIIWFSVVALFFSEYRVRDRLLIVRHWLDRIFGALLCIFGLALAATYVSLRS